jgi:fructoselysine-6-P-deglycase FrlB-like protein
MSPPVAIIEGPYLADILAQPRALEETIGGLSAVPEGLASIRERLVQGRFSHLVLTGMGSSFHALHPLHLDLVEAGLVGLFEGVRDLFLVGRGPSLAAAGAGGLILKESTHLHAEGMSSAAFRHGPLEMVGPSAFVLVLSGEARTRELNHRLVEDVRSAGGRAELLGEDAEHPGLRLPAGPPELRPVLELLPVEMASLALAALAGREAGRFTIASKVTASE